MFRSACSLEIQICISMQDKPVIIVETTCYYYAKVKRFASRPLGNQCINLFKAGLFEQSWEWIPAIKHKTLWIC